MARGSPGGRAYPANLPIGQAPTALATLRRRLARRSRLRSRSSGPSDGARGHGGEPPGGPGPDRGAALAQQLARACQVGSLLPPARSCRSCLRRSAGRRTGRRRAGRPTSPAAPRALAGSIRSLAAGRRTHDEATATQGTKTDAQSALAQLEAEVDVVVVHRPATRRTRRRRLEGRPRRHHAGGGDGEVVRSDDQVAEVAASCSRAPRRRGGRGAAHERDADVLERAVGEVQLPADGADARPGARRRASPRSRLGAVRSNGQSGRGGARASAAAADLGQDLDVVVEQEQELTARRRARRG